MDNIFKKRIILILLILIILLSGFFIVDQLTGSSFTKTTNAIKEQTNQVQVGITILPRPEGEEVNEKEEE